MKCRPCAGYHVFRRAGITTKTVITVFLLFVLFSFLVQLSLLPLPSTKMLHQKIPLSHGEEIPVSMQAPVRTMNRTAIDRMIGNGRAPKQVNEDVKRPSDGGGKGPAVLNDTKVLLPINARPTVLNDSKVSLPEAWEDPLPSLSGPSSLELLQKVLMKANKAQIIYNQNKFPPLAEDGLVLIVQVHKREGYLKQLLESLKVAKGIEKVLLVISHDYFYDDMNALIRSIDFCPVMQIFYPYSLQVLPSSFPGASPNDCPRDATRASAINMKCSNAHHPDEYGHYREAVVTAIKHHWWWKVNMVFDNLRVMQNYRGYVLFLEEDHYVSPDFLHVASQLIHMKQERCTDCDFINLGMYNKARVLTNRVSAGIWNAGKSNMGFGMNRHSWNRIRNCSEHFCSYDDYNWDWSLGQLGKACSDIKKDFKVLVMKTPRVFHIGTCGTHHHKSCNEAQQAKVVRDLLTKQSSNLFPSQLTLDGGLYPGASRKRVKPYGGWGDIRDHQLCMNFTQKAAFFDLKLPT